MVLNLFQVWIQVKTVPTQFLKEMAMNLAPSLTLIIPASLHRGDVPDDWEKAQVVLIYKNSDRYSPVNYRPISLTSIVYKTLKHILTASIYTHLIYYVWSNMVSIKEDLVTHS